MKLLALALAATIAASGTASAATFYFQETTANDTASFSLDTSKENYEGIGFDFGQTAVTTSSGVSSVDVSTFFGIEIQGSPAFTFEMPSGGIPIFGPSTGSFIADNFNSTPYTESFSVGTFTGQGPDQIPATLVVSTTPIASAVSAAPEPGAWALMLGGIGILGAMMRVAKARRREDELKSLATA